MYNGYLLTDNYTKRSWSFYIGGIFLWYPEGTPFVPRPRYTYIIIWEYYIYNIPPASSFPPLQFVLGEKSVAFQVFFQGLSLFLYNGRGLLNTSQWMTTQLSQSLNTPVEDTQHSIVEVYSTLNLPLPDPFLRVEPLPCSLGKTRSVGKKNLFVSIGVCRYLVFRKNP